jgi:hypothetical protein
MYNNLTPFFFNNIKPNIHFSGKSQPNQSNVTYTSKKNLIIPTSSMYLNLDVSAVDLNKSILVSFVTRSSRSSTSIINTPDLTKTTFFNHNSGILWPLRELIELFGVKNCIISDNRNLLLDYSLNVNPLLKSFPCEGVEEVYFNFLDQKVKKFDIFFIEL